MAHWAELDADNVVVRVLVCDADDGADGTLHPPAFLTSTEPGRLPAQEGYVGTWVRTYYDTEGHQFAGPGYVWDPTEGFTPPEPEVDMDQQRLEAVEQKVEAQAAMNAAMVDEDSYLWDALDTIAPPT